MQIEPIISFRGMDSSEAVTAKIHERLDKLERFHDRILACHVVVEAPHRHKHKGKIYEVRIDLSVPGGEIVVNREPGADHAHEDVYVAIRDAFDALRRQLEDYARKHSGHRAKVHPTPQQGRVVRLFADEGYGFIETGTGREIYFQRNSVAEGGWEIIDINVDVRFTEVEGEKGPHALNVTVIGPSDGD
jgi:ribosomal subunit interface protein